MRAPSGARWILSFLTACVVVVLSLAGAVAENDVTYQLTTGEQVEPLQRFRECDRCPVMIVMPTGSFMMGAIPGESRNPYDVFGENPSFRRRGPDEVNIIPQEHPRHRVEMDIAFAIGRNEVTYGEWMQCVEAGGCTHAPEEQVFTMLRNGRVGYVGLGPTYPVINVSYLDMLEYVAWLNALVGAEVYRLPTEAEWEYAARAGTETRFAQGDELTSDQANFSGNGTARMRGVEMPDLTNRRIPVPVDMLDAANGWGLRHMEGNVAEMTQSCWALEQLGLATDSAYLADAQSRECFRVTKGGSYASGMDYLRPAFRGSLREQTRTSREGFRVVREMR